MKAEFFKELPVETECGIQTQLQGTVCHSTYCREQMYKYDALQAVRSDRKQTNAVRRRLNCFSLQEACEKPEMNPGRNKSSTQQRAENSGQWVVSQHHSVFHHSILSIIHPCCTHIQPRNFLRQAFFKSVTNVGFASPNGENFREIVK